MITFRETGTSTNTIDVACSNPLSPSCGSVSYLAGSVSFSYSSTGAENVYFYSDNNDDPTDGVTEIHAALYRYGSFPSNENPQTGGDFPNAIVVDGFTVNSDHRDFKDALRTASITRDELEDISNYDLYDGNQTFSTVAFTDIAVPVELTSFTASVLEEVVKLSWQTATEVNNYGFEVERQILNQVQNDTWENIAFVEGHGNSNSPKEYSFIDSDNLTGVVQYRLKQIDINGCFEYSDVVEVEINSAIEFKLSQNYPNPFNPSTTIKYSIPNKSVIASGAKQSNKIATSPLVTLKVYDILGREIAMLVNENQKPGNYEVKFDASNLTSGIYFYKIQSGSFVESRKMQLIK